MVSHSVTEEAEYRTFMCKVFGRKFALSWGMGKTLDDIWTGEGNPNKKPIWAYVKRFDNGKAYTLYLGRHAFAFYIGNK